MTGKPLSGSLDRDAKIETFLRQHGWDGARRAYLSGDASNRRYETVEKEGRRLVLMDAPPDPNDRPLEGTGRTYSDIAHLATNCLPFVAIDHFLVQNGIHAPKIEAYDVSRGLILLEDFGPTGFTPLLEGADPSGDLVIKLYGHAVDLLCVHHETRAPDLIEVEPGLIYALPPYDEEAFLIEVSLFADWYLKEVEGEDPSPDRRAQFLQLWQDLLRKVARDKDVLVMRDYHSPNLHWFEQAGGIDRIGVIDFQDGLAGPPAYDLASLLQDARRDVPAAVEIELFDRYLSGCKGIDEEAFRRDYAIIAAQRVTKILGIFVRLWRRDGKKTYLQHIPRLWDYLDRSLAHPALLPLKGWLDINIPPSKRQVRG